MSRALREPCPIATGPAANSASSQPQPRSTGWLVVHATTTTAGGTRNPLILATAGHLSAVNCRWRERLVNREDRKEGERQCMDDGAPQTDRVDSK
jgi:hypothetical protein